VEDISPACHRPAVAQADKKSENRVYDKHLDATSCGFVFGADTFIDFPQSSQRANNRISEKSKSISG